jgi:sterol 14-demethylase
MGLVEVATDAVLLPINLQIKQHGLGLVVAAGFAAFIALAVLLNLVNQFLFQNPNEPPMVFHWFPVIGNTITYGMDPYAFFESCRDKVRIRYATLHDKH